MSALRDHALRVAVLTALLAEVERAHGEARRDAQKVFAAARRDGQRQQGVILPDGSEPGLISIHGAATWATVNNEDALLEWVEEHASYDVVEEIAPEAVHNLDIIALVKAAYPDLVRRTVRHSRRDLLIKEMERNGGRVTDKGTGESAQLGTVHRGDVTGKFTYRPDKTATERIVELWRAGQLSGVDVGPLALPAAPAGDDSPVGAP